MTILFFTALGGICLAIAFVRELGNPSINDPTRCPACKRDALLRIESARPSPIPLLHCRGCNEAYFLYGTSLVRDTGRPLF